MRPGLCCRMAVCAVVVLAFMVPCARVHGQWWEDHWNEIEAAYRENSKTKRDAFFQKWEQSSSKVREQRRKQRTVNSDLKVEEVALSIASKIDANDKITWLIQPEVNVMVVDSVDELTLPELSVGGVMRDFDSAISRYTVKTFSVRSETPGKRILLHDGMRITAVQRFVTGVSELASLRQPRTENTVILEDERKQRLAFLAPEIQAEVTSDGRQLRFVSPCHIKLICFDKEFKDAIVLVTYHGEGKLSAMRCRENTGRWIRSDSDLLRGVVFDGFK